MLQCKLISRADYPRCASLSGQPSETPDLPTADRPSTETRKDPNLPRRLIVKHLAKLNVDETICEMVDFRPNVVEPSTNLHKTSPIFPEPDHLLPSPTQIGQTANPNLVKPDQTQPKAG